MIFDLRSTCTYMYVTSYICSIIITVYLTYNYNLLQKHLEYQNKLETENETLKLEIEQLRKSSKVHTYICIIKLLIDFNV